MSWAPVSSVLYLACLYFLYLLPPSWASLAGLILISPSSGLACYAAYLFLLPLFLLPRYPPSLASLAWLGSYYFALVRYDPLSHASLLCLFELGYAHVSFSVLTPTAHFLISRNSLPPSPLFACLSLVIPGGSCSHIVAPTHIGTR